jgi:hypothetical protein
MGTAVRPAKTSSGRWDAFADVDVFVDEVLAELTVGAGDGTRPQRSGPKPPLAGAVLRKDSRSCRSAPSCFEHGTDGGKKIWGVKSQMAVEKYGIPLAIDVAPANRHDTKAIVPVLRELANDGFRGPASGDLGYRGKRLAEAGRALGITVEAIARGRDGRFIPAGIVWAEQTKVPRALARGMAVEGVERSFAWLSRYRRLKTIVERSKKHLIAFVEIASFSILSRRLMRLVVEGLIA